jgi:ATP-dependent DNA ligase
MSRYERQNYIDVDIATVDAARLPICQLKYDGIWCAADVAADGNIRYFSRNGNLKKEERTTQRVPQGLYIGELMFGSEWSKEQGRTGKFYTFDLVETKAGEHKNEPYLSRYTRLADFHGCDLLPNHWHLVPNYPTSQSLDIWQVLVASAKFEGLVFRNSADNWHQPLFRSKYETTKDLYITGYTEGEGRLSGTLGAIKASYSPVGLGVELTIGGGFSDKLRREIWTNRSGFLGRCITVTAKKEFQSGLLRHPNFKEFHREK